MEYYFFVIIVIIILKVLFWTFYFYVRAQRMRQARTTQRFIIVGTQPPGRGRLHPYNDRSAIIHHAEPVSVHAASPPAYSEVVKDGGNPLPPPYEQAVSGYNPPDVGGAPTGSQAAYPFTDHTPSVQSHTAAPQQPPVAQFNPNEVPPPPPPSSGH